nr:SurA N-terminal domain-containing protein [bacterium]
MNTPVPYRRLLIVVSLCIIAACSAPEDARIPLERDTSVVVTINGKNLTRDQMHRELMNLILTLGPEMTPQELQQRRGEFELQAIQNLINTELLVLEATRRDIRVSEEEIQQQLIRLQQAYQNGDDFRRELELRQLNPDELREE